MKVGEVLPRLCGMYVCNVDGYTELLAVVIPSPVSKNYQLLDHHSNTVTESTRSLPRHCFEINEQRSIHPKALLLSRLDLLSFPRTTCPQLASDRHGLSCFAIPVNLKMAGSMSSSLWRQKPSISQFRPVPILGAMLY